MLRGGSPALSRVPLSQIRSDHDRPRRQFPRESIEALAESIRLHGLLTPLLVLMLF
jgi:ParB-like chromosome segregation protein Spo0J